MEVRTAGGGLKDEKQKEREGEGGRSWQPTAGPPYSLLVPKPPARSLPITDFFNVHNTLYISIEAHVSEFTLYHLWAVLSASSLLKPTSNPSNIPAINLSFITSSLARSQS